MIEFSFDTIENFDRHIEISVPNYSHIYELIQPISTYFIKKNTNVYDLGCSTGMLLKALSVNNQVDNVNFIGYEISENMRPKQEMGFSWVKSDLTDSNLNLHNANVIFSIFTLQFLSIPERLTLLKKVFQELNTGGAFIVCEKTYIKNSFLNDVFTFSYYDYKLKSFNEAEILKKQRDLRFIMRPQTVKENIEMFKNAGFKIIECFFTSLMFKGWILIK